MPVLSKVPTVILLHAPREDDPYEAAFREAGYAPESVPVLRFERVGQAALREALARPGAYDGLVVTSPRAAEVLREALEQQTESGAAWTDELAFAVGPRTAEMLREVGFAPEGEESGGAEQLAERIARKSFGKPLLFLCGNRRRDALPDRLAEQNISLDERCVYETHLRDDLRLPDDARWLVFFSPSGVEAVRRASVDLGEVRCAALGPTTAGALREAGWPVAAVASEPTPEALVAAVRQAAPLGEQ